VTQRRSVLMEAMRKTALVRICQANAEIVTHGLVFYDHYPFMGLNWQLRMHPSAVHCVSLDVQEKGVEGESEYAPPPKCFLKPYQKKPPPISLIVIVSNLSWGWSMAVKSHQTVFLAGHPRIFSLERFVSANPTDFGRY